MKSNLILNSQLKIFDQLCNLEASIIWKKKILYEFTSKAAQYETQTNSKMVTCEIHCTDEITYKTRW